MNKKIVMILLVIITIIFFGCKKTIEPEQIVVEQEKEPALESPLEIVEEVVEQVEEVSEPEPPKREERPLEKVTVNEIFSKTFEGKIDLRNFPSMFVAWNTNNEKVFNGLLVVGKEAPVTDVVAAQNVAAGVNNGIRRPQYIISAVLDEQVENIKAQNAIVIGNPCDNKAAAVLIGNNECDANLQPNKALIKLYENNGYIQMVVVGHDVEGTLKASEYLKEYYKYDLSGLRYEFIY